MDETKNRDVFERMLFETLSSETTPVIGKCIYSAETLIASLVGELPQSEEDQLSAHLLICPACAKEYASIARSLQEDEEQLSSRVHVPSLAEHLRRRRDEQRGWHVLSSLLPVREHRVCGVIGVAVAALVIALSVIIPLHYLTGESPAIIPADGQMVAKGDVFIEAGVNAPSKLTPSTLVDKLDSMADYEPWRATAFVIGYLRSAGIPLDSAALAFERQTTYTTESGDTWQSVAQKTLGHADLWPIIILLNHNRTEHGEFPSTGTILRVPQARE